MEVVLRGPNPGGDAFPDPDFLRERVVAGDLLFAWINKRFFAAEMGVVDFRGVKLRRARSFLPETGVSVPRDAFSEGVPVVMISNTALCTGDSEDRL